MIELTYNENKLFMMFEVAVMGHARASSAQAVRDAGIGDPERLTASLIRKNYIESRNYGHNWRVVFLLRGRYKGQNTKMPPEHWLEHENSIQRRLNNDMRAIEKARGL